MLIRRELETDFDTIYNLEETAFQTAQFSSGTEQDYVIQLRNGNNYIPELAFVAEIEGKIVGHIMLTKIYIHTDNEQFEMLLLAALAVAIEYRNQGIGSKLINDSFALAKEMGYSSVILVGNSHYYSRFGFKSSMSYGIKNVNDIPDEYVQACELIPEALKEISGTVNFD